MAKIPEPANGIQSLIDACHESIPEDPRPHLGCSLLGNPCDRWIWLSFRWAVIADFPGRVLRLFRRGRNEEATVISDLRAIGLDVRCKIANKQIAVNFGAHVSGSLDGVIESGVPEAPKARHVLEIKTHSIKSFNDVEKNGVVKSKPEHFTQMQSYMHGMSIDRALYVAVCKDDDRIYTERVKYDKNTAEKAISRGKNIALSDRMPPPISDNPSWYQCKMCPAYGIVCFREQGVNHDKAHRNGDIKMANSDWAKYIQVNCRTCAHSTAMEDSTWRCERHNADNIPLDFQRTGCDAHVLHPDIVPWKLDTKASTQHEAVWIINDKPVKNGEPDWHVYSSRDILTNPAACADGDNVVEAIRNNFDAEIIDDAEGKAYVITDKHFNKAEI